MKGVLFGSLGLGLEGWVLMVEGWAWGVEFFGLRIRKSSFGYLDDGGLQLKGRQLCALLCRLLSRSLSVLQVTVSGFGFRISGFGFRVSGFGFQVSGFGALLNCPLPSLSPPTRCRFRV